MGPLVRTSLTISMSVARRSTQISFEQLVLMLFGDANSMWRKISHKIWLPFVSLSADIFLVLVANFQNCRTPEQNVLSAPPQHQMFFIGRGFKVGGKQSLLGTSDAFKRPGGQGAEFKASSSPHRRWPGTFRKLASAAHPRPTPGRHCLRDEYAVA